MSASISDVNKQLREYMQGPILDQLKRDAEHLDRITKTYRETFDNGPTMVVPELVTLQEIETRHLRYLEWQAFTDQLIADEVLTYGHCYECEGTLEEQTATTRFKVVPNPEYKP